MTDQHRSDRPNEPSREDVRIDRLIRLACDDALEPEDRHDLAATVRENTDARERYLRAMGLECLLTLEHDEHPIDSLLGPAMAGEAPANERRASPMARLRDAPWAPSTRLSCLLALAASLLLAVGAVGVWEQTIALPPTAFSYQPPEGRPVGMVTRVSNAAWEGDAPLGPRQLLTGQRLRLLSGDAELALSDGVTFSLRGPAEIEIVSGHAVRATSGSLHATASRLAEGFVIQTPCAHIVQVGPDLSDLGESPGDHVIAAHGERLSNITLEVLDDGSTEVSVGEGQVALQYLKSTIRSSGFEPVPISFRSLRSQTVLQTGQSLTVDGAGGLSGLPVSLGRTPPRRLSDERRGVVRSVRDNRRAPDSDWFPRVIEGGFAEDARAYVDRLHQWNGVGGTGLPAFLVGGDYVQTFYSDKWSGDHTMTIELKRPADVYILMDDRLAPPAWLVSRFVDTGFDVGLDEGWNGADGNRRQLTASGRLAAIAGAVRSGSPADLTGAGPGQSIDAVHSVWRLTGGARSAVTLGPSGPANDHTTMYGIVVTAQ